MSSVSNIPQVVTPVQQRIPSNRASRASVGMSGRAINVIAIKELNEIEAKIKTIGESLGQSGKLSTTDLETLNTLKGRLTNLQTDNARLTPHIKKQLKKLNSIITSSDSIKLPTSENKTKETSVIQKKLTSIETHLQIADQKKATTEKTNTVKISSVKSLDKSEKTPAQEEHDLKVYYASRLLQQMVHYKPDIEKDAKNDQQNLEKQELQKYYSENEILSPNIVLNNYALITTSAALFDAIAQCLNSDMNNKDAILSFTKDWFNSQEHDVESTLEPTKTAIDNLMRSVDEPTRKVIDKLTQEVKTRLEVTHPRNLKNLEAEAKAHLKIESQEIFQKGTNELKPDLLKRLNNATTWLKIPDNYNLYKSDPETRQLIGAFAQQLLNDPDQQIKQAAQEMTAVMIKSTGKINIFGQISESKTAYKQKLQEFAHDLLVIESNLASNVKISEWHTDLSKQTPKIESTRPGLAELKQNAINVTNFVGDQILISVEQALQEAEKTNKNLSKKEIQKILIKSTEFFVDLAQTCYDKGDFASSYEIMMGIFSVETVINKAKENSAYKPLLTKINGMNAKTILDPANLKQMVQSRLSNNQSASTPIQLNLNMHVGIDTQPDFEKKPDGTSIINVGKLNSKNKLLEQFTAPAKTLKEYKNEGLNGSLVNYLSDNRLRSESAMDNRKNEIKKKFES